MFLRELSVTLDHIKGIGQGLRSDFARVGITNVAGLLCHYPRDWEDRSQTVLIGDFQHAKVCTVARVIAHDWFGFGAMKTLKVHIEDESGRAVLACFNRNFLEKQLVVGRQYRILGSFFYKYGEIQSSSFDFEPVEKAGGFGHILPVYPLWEGMTQNRLRSFIRQALDQYAVALENELPVYLAERMGLWQKTRALGAIHFPASYAELEKARQTLIYEELFYLEVLVGKRAMERRLARKKVSDTAEASGTTKVSDTVEVSGTTKVSDTVEVSGTAEASGTTKVSDTVEVSGTTKVSGTVEVSGTTKVSGTVEVSDTAKVSGTSPAFTPLQQRLLERLPFSLTAGQSAAVMDINRDMDSLYPMARLLQGDVGSGKTLVSFLAALKTIENGGQAAIMAPTELLARQHAENAARLLEPLGVRPAFLTGNIKASGRTQLLKNLVSGTIDIVVGTHALFSKDVVYKDLRLVVIDEQHRFGVLQRQAIMTKGELPDLLMMSATPIPRTLALTVFGDMDVSVIRDMPPGRKPILTHLASESSEARVYDFIHGQLAVGRQAYFVYPLIEFDETKSLKDAETMVSYLSREVFPQYATALIHSKIDEDAKRDTMEDFRRGAIRVLVATSVVEVGVDVPNATCMVIEHAERFGLSALHQLRGRIGRGTEQSYCFLVYSGDGSELTDDGKQRLKVMKESTDGFVIAEEDLRLRGPGQIAGTEQSGYISLSIADPLRDAAVLEQARADAFAMLEKDSGLLQAEHRCVAEVLTRAPPFANVNL